MAHRIERVNSLIRQEISELLQRQVKDPRLGNFITVNDVSTSSDLKYAKVYISCIGSGVEKEEVLSALAAAAGFLRRELAKNLKLRYTPELNFKWDDSIEHAEHISQLIDQVISEQDHI